MKVVLRYCVVLLVVLVGVSVQAQEPLILYDDFNTELIDPGKWFGEQFGFAGREAVRLIRGNHLHLVDRAYGGTDSDSGTK